jgi:hypothetical protein
VAGGGPTYITGRVKIMSPDRYWHHLSSNNHENGTRSSFNSKRLDQCNARAWSVVRKFDMTLNGEIGVNPLIPASLNGCANIGLCNWPYRVPGPSTGSNGMSSIGYSEKSEVCFFSFCDDVEQCASSYDMPLRILVMHHGPVNG